MGVFDKTTNESIGGGIARPNLLEGVASSLGEIQHSQGGSSWGEDIVVYGRAELWTSGYVNIAWGGETGRGDPGYTPKGALGEVFDTCKQLFMDLEWTVAQISRYGKLIADAKASGDKGAEIYWRGQRRIAEAALIDIMDNLKWWDCREDVAGALDIGRDDSPPDWQV